MTKRSWRWSRSIRAASANVLIILCWSALAFGQPPPEQVAQKLYGEIATKYGNATSLTQSVVIPMTTNTKMTTVDGTRSFYTSQYTTCPSTDRLVTISILPMASGDIERVVVSEDLDTDGNVEYSYVSPYIVSGICANGFVSCDAGTWNNCVNLKWTANSQGHISMAFTSNQELGSCYCINNNCGSNIAIRQLSYILYSLGSGVIGALQQAVGAKYAISDGIVSGMTIHYTGQTTSSCAEQKNTSLIGDRKSTRLNSSHQLISYAVFCFKKILALVIFAKPAADSAPQKPEKRTKPLA